MCLLAMWLVLRSVRLDDVATLADGREVVIVDWGRDTADTTDEDIEKAAIEVVDGDTNLTVLVGDLARDDAGQPRFEIGLKTAYSECETWTLLWALLVYAPVPILQSVRFTWMVRAQEITLSYWEGIKLSYAGNFLNFVAIGSTGGDIFKAYYVSCHTDRKTEAVTTVLLDRAMGLISLVLIALIAMVVRFDDPRLRAWFPVVLAMAGGLVVLGLVVFSSRIRGTLRINALLQRLPFSDQLRRIDAATVRLRHNVALVVMAILMTMVLQSLAITSIVICANALGMNTSPELYAGYFAYLALGLVVATIPISYQGVGTMDGVLQIFLKGTYGSYSQILFLGFAIRLLQLCWALPGFLVPITGAHRPSTDKIAQLNALASPSES